KPVPLHKFNKQEVSAYFESHGIHDPNLLDIAIRYTQGHPLALSLFLLMAQREGTESVTKLSERADLIEELLTRWLSELNDPQLQHLLETASVAHQFDLSLLSSLVEGEVDEDSFDELAKLPFIYRVGDSWIMHDSAREVLSRGIRSRQPAQYRKLRVLCLEYFANLATGPGTEQERKMALENVYALIGDTLVRGAMFKSTQHAENLYLEPAVLADLPDLQAYMDEWRDGRNQSASSPLEIRDHNGQLIQNEWILAESQEPDYIDIQSILTLMPGAFQILKDSKQRIHGISIVFPINAATIDYLKHQAVTRHFFQSLDKHELQSYMQAPQNTDSAFLRLIDVRDQNDHSAREVLIRNLVGLLLKPMRFVTSTPLRFYQALLSRFGFEVRNGILHYEFGDDRPSPYFVLDVRKIPLVTRLKEMIMAQSGNSGITEQDEPREEERKDSDIFFKLTTREKEVAEAAIEGLANCSIAARLDVSEITIKKHMSRIFEKTGTRNRNQLIQKYWKLAGSKQAENEHN
ncbi:MAG: helix-turn-helix transcriptional regulator, partial [Gammaproteobacteria bacterium]|nr:helix-turn-helix transcriptional regulator [Gammaproteobacteria bacterium]